MWFKKKAHINGYKSNTAVDGTDWRTNGNTNSSYASQTLLSAADANKYFYLPALGAYFDGRLNGVGGNGYYWSSSAYPWRSVTAYSLYFYSRYVNVGDGDRPGGFRVEPTVE